jgi:hypothetical protein
MRRFFFGHVRLARSCIAWLAFSGFGNGIWRRSICPLLMLSFLIGPAESSRGALRQLGFDFRQCHKRFVLTGIPRA